MSPNAQAIPHSHNTSWLIDQCVEFARGHGISDFQSDRRSKPRWPFAHHIRYSLDRAGSDDDSHPGYALNISRQGMAICTRQALGLGHQISVRLPLPDGSTTWVTGKVIHCEPDDHHYQVGIAFLCHE